MPFFVIVNSRDRITTQNTEEHMRFWQTQPFNVGQVGQPGSGFKPSATTIIAALHVFRCSLFWSCLSYSKPDGEIGTQNKLNDR